MLLIANNGSSLYFAKRLLRGIFLMGWSWICHESFILFLSNVKMCTGRANSSGYVQLHSLYLQLTSVSVGQIHGVNLLQ